MKRFLTVVLFTLLVPQLAFATACEDALMGAGAAPLLAKQICTLSPANITLTGTLTAEQVTSTDDMTVTDAITADDFLPDTNGGGHLGSTAARFDSMHLGNATATFSCAYSTNTMQCGSIAAHDWQLLSQNAAVLNVASTGITVPTAKVLAVDVGTLAAAGTGVVADAAQIVDQTTYISASDNTKAVKLPAAPVVGAEYDIFNTVASKNLPVFPLPTGAAINGGTANASITIYGKTGLRCSYSAANTWQCGTLGVPGVKTLFVPAGIGRAGTTAGWTNTGTNINEATMAAGGTASTFTIPITGLEVGDTIESYKVIGQVESAGGAVTLDADLRTLTNAAGDPVDASIGAITQVAVTADTAVASAKTLATASLVATGTSYYVLLTGTTAGSTDVRLLGVEVVVRREN